MVKKKIKFVNLWSQAKKVIPGGNMLLSKRPEMFLPNSWPTYYSKSKGCNIWDLNNKKYIDVSLMGVGTNILGYANSAVDKKVKEVIKKGNMTTLNCSEEVELAKKLLSMHEWNGMVKFARTGGEAAAIAVRIARAYTKKDKVMACGYHGWHDWYLASNLKNTSDLNGHLLNNTKFEGVPKNLKKTIQMFDYNNIKNFKKIFEKNKKHVGVIIMEVSRNFQPDDNFLKTIAQTCKKNNVILIVDECSSGFRESFGGLYKKYNFLPDIVLYGKAIGNGYPLTAIVGKKRIMQKAQDTFISSTFWTDRIGPVAALETLKQMEKIKSWEVITNKGKLVKKEWKKIFDRFQLNVDILGIDVLPLFKFKNKSHLKYKTFITQEMLKKGYLASNIIYLSIAHTDQILKKYFIHFEQVIKKLSNLINQKKFRLNNAVCHSEMKRIN